MRANRLSDDGIDVGEVFVRKTARRDLIVSSARSDLEWFVVGEAIGSSRVGVGSCQCRVWRYSVSALDWFGTWRWFTGWEFGTVVKLSPYLVVSMVFISKWFGCCTSKVAGLKYCAMWTRSWCSRVVSHDFFICRLRRIAWTFLGSSTMS